MRDCFIKHYMTLMSSVQHCTRNYVTYRTASFKANQRLLMPIIYGETIPQLVDVV